MTTEAPTADTVLADVERQLAGLPSDDLLLDQLNELRQKRDTLANRVVSIRSATSTLAGLGPKIAAEIEWRDHLVEWRKTLCAELLALPPRIRNEKELGTQQNLKFSILAIDHGLVSEDTGWSLETLRVGHLMRAAGYAEGPKIENQVCGQLPWFGSLPEVEKRIAALQQRRDAAQRELDNALLDGAGRERLAAEEKARRDAFNAAPKRGTRGDGSQYDRYPDGRVVEVMEPTTASTS